MTEATPSAPTDRERMMLLAEGMVRFRHMGVSHYTIARTFGWSRSSFYRDLAGPLDGVVSQMGQDETENTRIVTAWVSQLGQMRIGPRAKRRPSLPRESEAARLIACLAGLDRLTNRDPAEIVAEMPPDMREDAVRLAERAAEWLAGLNRPRPSADAEISAEEIEA